MPDTANCGTFTKRERDGSIDPIGTSTLGIVALADPFPCGVSETEQVVPTSGTFPGLRRIADTVIDGVGIR